MRRLDLSILLGAMLSSGAAAAEPELVTVPMATLGTSASEGMEAWKIVGEAFEGAKGRLGVSLVLQKQRHDFVVGPAREQVRDCALGVDCLQGVGGALGADILVAGQVTPKSVRLLAVEVETGRVLADAETPTALEGGPLESRASAAARLLVGQMVGAEAQDPATSSPPVAAAPGPSSAVPGGSPAPSGPPGGGEDDLKGFEDEPSPSPATEPAPPPAPRSAALQGTLRIPADQLRGVRRVSIDAEPLSFSGDGSITWSGAPGDHRLVAEKSDGARLARNVFLEPGSTTNVVLEWPGVAPTSNSASAETARGRESESVLGKWWFWTSIGAAVAAGATTAALLAGGDKGGPVLPGATGRIRGSY